MPYHKDGDALLLRVPVFKGDPETIGEAEITALLQGLYTIPKSLYCYVPNYNELVELRSKE